MASQVVELQIDDRAFRRAALRLAQRSPDEIETVARTLVALGREYARDIITVVIYATPQRGDYKRTRYLIRSIYGAVERIGSGAVRMTIGAAAEYAIYNELGTLSGYPGENAAAEILEAARKQADSELIILEYGRPETGLEPRPFIIPALVMMERRLPGLVFAALKRLGEKS